MKYLVTGGSGMLGKHLQEVLPDMTYLSSADCDLKDYRAVLELFNAEKPDGVIHLAARVGGILENIQNPAIFYDENIQINTNTLMAAHQCGVEKFIAVLSTCMYPDTVSSYPMVEEDVHKGPPANANFSYAYTKRCMAVQIEAYRHQYGLDYSYLIPCNLYGEHDNFENSNKSHFVTALIKKIIDAEDQGNNKISLFGSGTPMRQFMYSGDLAAVIKRVVEGNITESFNVAPPGQNYSIHQMATMALDVLGNGNWSIDYDATKPDGQFRKDVSCDRMIESLGEVSFTSFRDGVLKVYEALRQGEKQ